MIYKTKILPYFDYADILYMGTYQRLRLIKCENNKHLVLRIFVQQGIIIDWLYSETCISANL